ncbi:phosphatidylglycerol lysyltransferase domain-containing protein [Hufsiella ginkgonis]|uniref:Phosphatidylglycerol lysyltransferase n=1 Tax=Hufsiella ginkgonis TaxID=2695274 RepID=A0A7K1Y0K0_9SPHI|nr:phosphatidylglycerol lysyltransferase domain-containing protein [Hufsiella ginkgonis]MXV16608.1 DUF2156 domain-containing protein [Hufsiella ginkgonis]
MYQLKKLLSGKSLPGMAVAAIGIGFAAWFAWTDRQEMQQAIGVASSGNRLLMGGGLLLTAFYLLLHGWMYQSAFRATGERTVLTATTRLFLQRNLVSVFLPGGGITSLALFTRTLHKQGVSRSKINFASYLYGVIGIASLVIVSFPVLVYETLRGSEPGTNWVVLSILAVFVCVISWTTWSAVNKTIIYRLLTRISPTVEKTVEEISGKHLSWKPIAQMLGFSLLIELAGMVHLLLAMMVLGLNVSIEAAVTGYTVATLFLCVSPFLRGLGAVELSLTLILGRFGFTVPEAMAITLLYRVFEFWAPLMAGVLSFVFTKENILLRVFPAALLFGLGLVNIISVLTPAISSRLKLLKEFVPVGSINASNYLVLGIGAAMLVLAAFLLRGIKNAWYLAITLSLLSLIGHLTKAIDYEEAFMASGVAAVLWVTRHNYFIRGDRASQQIGAGLAVWAFFAVLVFGVTGFYFLDQRHFGIDFSFRQALFNTLDNFMLLNSAGLSPKTAFANVFLLLINVSGAASFGFLFYSFIKPLVFRHAGEDDQHALAAALLNRFGRSPVDYFKLYPDKLLFFGAAREGFVSYKRARGFAIVLEEPVCENDPGVRTALLHEFEIFCKTNGIRPSYYRIDETGIDLFRRLGKKSILIGQEALIDLRTFTLEGKERKSLRNAVNSITKKGFLTRTYEAPIKDGLIRKLKLVSDEWLKSMDREEMVFSQGMFNWAELKNQSIITLENADEQIFAFLNIIPDYAEGEATYDMIRKTVDAPGGNMDVLILELIRYCKEKGYHRLNMGLAPLSGIGAARDFPEHTIKFAYEKVKQFRHFRGLRSFKEKFDPCWQNKYLVYEHHFDLIRLPGALAGVMKVEREK